MANEEPEVIWEYMAAGVQSVMAIGSTSFIGDLGGNQVLKYPHVATDREAIEHEARIYHLLGRHPRILRCYGLDESGLRLEKAANGTLREILQTHNNSPREKLKWSRQLAEAVEYIHTKHVLHCDISPRNCFITSEYDLQLGDFQGQYRAQGNLHKGFCAEGTKSYLPRRPGTADHYSDLFAVGSAVYEIMTGHEPYEHLDSIDDMEEIESLFKDGKFPSTDHLLAGNVIQGCWRQRYDSAEQCAKDLASIEKNTADHHLTNPIKGDSWEHGNEPAYSV
jgi:serine/threonine protein kinase